jgi:hypothetical protein
MEQSEIEFIFEYPDKWIVRLITYSEGKKIAGNVITPYRNRSSARIATIHTIMDNHALAQKYFGSSHEEASAVLYRLISMPEEERKAWLGGVVACNS